VVETQTFESTRLEFRWSTTDPWFRFIKLITQSLAAVTGHGGETHIQAIPALCLGDRLVFRALKSGKVVGPVEGEPRLVDDEEGAYEVEIDGRPHGTDQDVVAAELGEGFHLMVVVGEDEKLGTVKVQLPLSIVHPLAFKPTPVTRLRLSGSTNGDRVAMVLSNRSGSDHVVQIQVTSVPAGWMALLLDDPVLVLRAGESKECTIQIERMVPWRHEASLSFTVRAGLPGSDLPDTTNTFLVDVAEEETHGRLPTDLPAEPLLSESR